MNINFAHVEDLPSAIKTAKDPSKSTISSNPSPAKPTPPAKITLEVPAGSDLPMSFLDPTWIKVWDQVGPLGYLGILCLLLWLLTRFVETVKSK